MTPPLLEIRNLNLRIPVAGSMRPILEQVNFTIDAGKAFGLVGESGSGKSMTARTIIKLLPPGAEIGGDILLDGKSTLTLPSRELRQIRAREVQMIFQDPRAHINPVRRVGDFLTEALRTDRGLDGSAAASRVIEILDKIGVANAKARLRQYPHELSGGLLQRMMIASALAAEPRLLVADEPTTALDTTTQADVVALIDDLRREKNLGLLFITHDLELASAICDETGVMYAGSLLEVQGSVSLHHQPLHPYTAGLLASRPSLTARTRLMTIAGSPMSLAEAPPGCLFAPRCPYRQDQCLRERPVVRRWPQGEAACVRTEELVGELERVVEQVPV
jgi:oligopeptide/dipeptide ABC transporter ATP-binding protein